MTRLLYTQHAPNPGYHLVTGRVTRLVEVNDSISDVLQKRPLQWRVSARNGRVMTRAHVELVIVLWNENGREWRQCDSSRRALMLGCKWKHTKITCVHVEEGGTISGGDAGV